MTEYLVPLFVIAVLIAINGLFVAAEFAIVSVPYTRIARRAEEGARWAGVVLAVLKDADKRNNYIAAAQIGITIASLGLGMYGEATLAAWLLGPLEHFGGFSEALAHTIAFVIAVGALTYFHVVLGEMIPKSLAIQSAESMVLKLAGPMSAIEKVFRPLIIVLNGMGNAITRLLGVPPLEAHERLYSAEELEFIVEESTVGGLLAPDEQLYFENIFDFSERTVSQVMTPRNRMVGIPVDADLDDVISIVTSNPYTRYPVYDNTMDVIVGKLHVKNLARQQVNPTNDFNLETLIRPALFVPESSGLQQILDLSRTRGQHMIFVVDEFGGTAGLVTIEDLVEEVVGEINELEDGETPPMLEIRPGVIQVRGDLILDELNQHYDLDLRLRDVETVGGMIMALLGHIPRAGEEVETAGVRFQVLAIDGLAVDTALLILPDTSGLPSS
ncbi:MAG: HlyC/CorC family transporter [Chloroflexi bacterium]|nr:HlyC/CorC family transporter [Chloroflexota bacterium]